MQNYSNTLCLVWFFWFIFPCIISRDGFSCSGTVTVARYRPAWDSGLRDPNPKFPGDGAERGAAPHPAPPRPGSAVGGARGPRGGGGRERRSCPCKMAAAGLCPYRALLARRGGALRALCGSVRGLAAGPETHFGFQTVTEAERREKSEGGGGARCGAGRGLAGPGGAGTKGGSRAAGACGAKGYWKLGRWFETLPGVSGKHWQCYARSILPLSAVRVTRRGCVSPKRRLSGNELGRIRSHLL